MACCTARWTQHLLKDKKKRTRLATTRKLPKMFPKYKRKQFDIITGDETWVHLFKPTKLTTKYWLPKTTTVCQMPKDRLMRK